MKGLRGFDSLRTRIPEPVEAPEKPRCERCGAVLRSGNTDTLCSPCGRGEIEIPDWALDLAESTDGRGLGALASVLRSMQSGKFDRYLVEKPRGEGR